MAAAGCWPCRCVSRQDADLIRAKGLAVVDCSWNRLDDVPFGAWRVVGGGESVWRPRTHACLTRLCASPLHCAPSGRIRGAAPRLLPFFVAANPVNYGACCYFLPACLRVCPGDDAELTHTSNAPCLPPLP
jgi:pre-rRNA-processing protein TSR3